MEHFFRIAFWIFTLSGCLQAKSISTGDLNIGLIRKGVSCPSDSRFYAPTNVEEQCITTGLDCVMKELDTVEDECEDDDDRISEVRDILERLIDKRELTNSTDCACERSSGSRFGVFLKKIASLVQLHETRTHQRATVVQ